MISLDMWPEVTSIVCVHPNAELYGSDRVFLQAVRAFKTRWPDAEITVILPREGLLSSEVRQLPVSVRIEPMVVLRRAHLACTAANLLRLPGSVARALALLRGRDLVYISTVIPLDFLLATRFTRGAVLIHVHELPTGTTRALFTTILRCTRGVPVFISAAVRDAFRALAGRRSAIIWNGARTLPAVVRTPSDKLKVLLIGRFNAWKGQGLLIEAIARIPSERRRLLAVRLVGSAFAGQEHFEQAAVRLIAEGGLADSVAILGFAQDPEPLFNWADVVVVPSTRPEPFGLVAIEAMSAGCAVIASDHGGLSEIVVNGETGHLVRPGDADRLAAALCRYLDDPALVSAHGAAGRRRFNQAFRDERFIKEIADLAGAEVARSRDAM